MLKDYKNIIIFVAIIFIVICGAFFYFLEIKKIQEIKLPEAPPPLSPEELIKILEEKNISKCGELDNLELRTTCQNSINLRLAYENSDPSFCEKLIDEPNATAETGRVSKDCCKIGVVGQKALKEGKVEVCQELVEEELIKVCKEEYYLSLALEKGDINFCSQIKDEKSIEECKKDYQNLREVIPPTK